MNNPINMLKTLMTKSSPNKVVEQLLANNSNPIFSNLINMARKGDNKGIENFARNYYKEQGRDFDKEFSDFMQNFK